MAESNQGQASSGHHERQSVYAYSCNACDNIDTDEMVQCDDCDEWYHYTCAGQGITHEIADVPWSCSDCVEQMLLQTMTPQQSPHSALTNQINTQFSQRDSSSSRWSAVSTSTKRSRKMALSFLDEQKELETQQLQQTFEMQRKYLQERYKILRLKLESQSSKDEEESSNRNLSVKQWIEDQAEQSNKPARISKDKLQEALFFAKHIEDQRTPLSTVQGRHANVPWKELKVPMSERQSMNISEKVQQSQDDQVKESFMKKEESNTRANVPLSQFNVLNWPNITRGRNDNQTKINLPQRTRREVSRMVAPELVYADNIVRSVHPHSKPIVDVQKVLETSPEQIMTDRPMPTNSTKSSSHKHENVQSQTVEMPEISSLTIQPLNNTGLPNTRRTLDSGQIAARHILPRDLPKFYGSPNEWPMFISGYESSTQTGGYSNAENLIRLQRCLKGKALEAVRSILLVPDNVPSAIETLRMMYGRPDLIIYTLINQVKQATAPRMEKMESIVNYALTVRNLCATIRSCNMVSHMNNPFLIQEIVEKLPPTLKLEWSKYKRTIPNVTLETLGAWLYEVAQAASEIIIPVVSSTPSNINPIKKLEHKPDHKPEFKSKENKCYILAQAEKDKDPKVDSSKCKICSLTCSKVENCKMFKEFSVDKRWSAVKQHGLCSTCLKTHRRFQCKDRKKCQEKDCDRWHHLMLHQDSGKGGLTNEESKTVVHVHPMKCQPVIYRIVPVILHGKELSFETFAYLDEGSGLTLMEDHIATYLGIGGEEDSLCLRWTSKVQRSELHSRKVLVHISDVEDLQRFEMKNVRTVQSLDLPEQTITTSMMGRYPHLNGIPIQPYERAISRILIGLENVNLIVSLETIEGEWQEPVATKTRLGWLLQGGQQIYKKKSIPSMPIGEGHPEEDLHILVKEYFSLDSFGVKVSNKIMESSEEARARRILESTTSFDNGRCESALLWKEGEVIFPNTYPMALKRLESLEKKMQKNPDLAENLNKQFQEYVAKDYIRKLTQEEIDRGHKNSCYLPVFPVLDPKKIEKVRIVWDAAAEVDGVSLNSKLLTGPDLLEALPDILYRFRERKVAICGDLKEMFHQISVRKEDQDAQRFLWRNGDQCRKPDVYVMQRMTFGATCSPCIAQYVKNTNAMKYEHQFPRAVMSIVKNHYVDDMLDCMDNVEEAVELMNQVKLIHAKVGFEMRKFMSNSSEVLEALGEKTKPNTVSFSMIGMTKIERVLGMYWQVATDTFTFSLRYSKLTEDLLNGKRRPTKREVLRTLMTIFDPLGLLSFFLIYVKILLQDIWGSSVGWDDQITDIQFAKWMTWIELLPRIEQLHIPRLYSTKMSPEKPRSIELHVFVDASEHAFSAVAYFRVEDDDGVDCVLVGSKTRVAPRKPMSIPRLELQAAVLGSRYMNHLVKTHTLVIQRCCIWSDSKVVLSWLHSEARKYRQFVALRIGEILELTNVDQWRWVDTKNNVADEATKWAKKPIMSNDSRWFKGPSFLKEVNYGGHNAWLDNVIQLPEEEMRYQCSHAELIPPVIPDPARFSKWERLCRTQAYVLRFIRDLPTIVRCCSVEVLTPEELQSAEWSLFRRSQFDGFGEEVAILRWNMSNADKTQKGIDHTSSIIDCLPYIDEEGVLRVHGRIDATPGISYESKRSIILPRKHRITHLLVDWYHRRFHHANFETVINELRQRFYIPRIRLVLKSVVAKCQYCKNKRAQPVVPSMADLPAARLSAFSRPFTNIGIDYFGPIKVTMYRRTVKRWGVLITCLTTRAIRIEIAYSLDTDSCIMVLRNFMARAGQVSKIYSDNGSNFHASDNELRAEFSKMDPIRMEQEFNTFETKWYFNPPTASHMGGSWERLIRSIKTSLHHILQTQHPSDELLRNVLMECESVVNSRPLTFVSIHHAEAEALTPNHFILGSSGRLATPCELNPSQKVFKENWKLGQQLVNYFWRRWIREYLPTITRRTKWFSNVKSIAVGDVVFVVDGNLKRNTWPRGIVTEVYRGNDNKIRSALVKTANGVYHRPVAKLAILDVIAPSDEVGNGDRVEV